MHRDGFDDTGRQYDAKGNLKDWWTAEDAAKFKVQADRLEATGYLVEQLQMTEPYVSAFATENGSQSLVEVLKLPSPL